MPPSGMGREKTVRLQERQQHLQVVPPIHQPLLQGHETIHVWEALSALTGCGELPSTTKAGDFFASKLHGFQPMCFHSSLTEFGIESVPRCYLLFLMLLLS